MVDRRYFMQQKRPLQALTLQHNPLQKVPTLDSQCLCSVLCSQIFVTSSDQLHSRLTIIWKSKHSRSIQHSDPVETHQQYELAVLSVSYWAKKDVSTLMVLRASVRTPPVCMQTENRYLNCQFPTRKLYQKKDIQAPGIHLCVPAILPECLRQQKKVVTIGTTVPRILAWTSLLKLFWDENGTASGQWASFSRQNVEVYCCPDTAWNRLPIPFQCQKDTFNNFWLLVPENCLTQLKQVVL